MPLSSAERSKKFRERLKRCNPEKYLNIKQKANERATKYYRKKKCKKMTEEQKEELWAKWGLQDNERKKNNLDNEQRMPLSAAEKSKRYRERLKRCNPEKYLKMKQKNNERAIEYYKRKKCEEMTEEQKEELRAKWSLQNNARKKNNLDNEEQQQTSQNDIPIRNISFNKTIKRNLQPRTQRNLKNDNTKLRNDIQNLKKRFNSLEKQMQIQQQELVKVNQNYEIILKKLEEKQGNVIKINTSVELVKEDPLLCTESTIKEEHIVDELNIETLKTDREEFEHDLLTEYP